MSLPFGGDEMHSQREAEDSQLNRLDSSQEDDSQMKAETERKRDTPRPIREDRDWTRSNYATSGPARVMMAYTGGPLA